MAAQIPVSIDRRSPVPLSHQLAQQLAAAIDTGVLKPGDAFENELALAERLEVSRPTVRRAIGDLAARGLLVRRRGIGTTVAKAVVHRRKDLAGLFDDLVREGRTPLTEVLAFEPGRSNPEVARILGLEPDTPLVHLERLRWVEEGPVAVLRNWLPPQWAGLDPGELTGRGLFSILRSHGVVPAVAQQAIGARPAGAAERRLLRLGQDVAVLTMSRRTYDAAGTPVEFADHCYRHDRYRFDVTVYAT